MEGQAQLGAINVALAGAAARDLTGPMPLNFPAADSDVHVTGLNPAGTASLTDLSFVANRFRIAQVRRPLSSLNRGALHEHPHGGLRP